MEDNKDLGKLFKERLANVEAEPSSALWSQIEKTLDHKQKRRGFIWLWLGLLALLSISSLLYFNTIGENIYDYKMPLELPTSDTDIQQNNKSQSERVIVPKSDPDKDDQTSDQNTMRTPDGLEEVKVLTKSNTVTKNNPIAEKPRQSEKSILQKSTSPNRATLPSNTRLESESNVAQQPKSENSVSLIYLDSVEGQNFPQAQNNLEKGTPHKSKNEASAKVAINSTTKNSPQKNEANLDIEDREQIIPDSIAKKKHLKEKKKTAQNEIVKEEPIWRNWLLSIQAGPNMFGHLNNSSPFESGLTSGQTKLNVSYSYGLLVNVPIGEKTVFRFGYKRANLKLATAQAISAINENGAAAILTSNAIKRNAKTIAPAFEQSLSSSEVFRIDQEINYQGIPIEFLYRLMDGKIKIDALVGASAHVLGKSTIRLKNENGSYEAGSTAYLKKFAVVPTIGTTFRYQASENFSFDLEPTFQYQINAFENGFKNTHPLLISITIGGTLKL